MRKLFIIVLLAVCAGVVDCGSENPEIFISQNVFNLNGVNGLISGEGDLETVCPYSGCTSNICWKNDGNLIYGYCLECDVTQNPTSCSNGTECDHGWCHKTCGNSTECNSTEFCTGGICRKPNTVDVAIYNVGNRSLEIYKDKTKIYGGADACAFYRLMWGDDSTSNTVMLSKGNFVILRVNFTPTDITTIHRAYVVIYSNDPKLRELPLALCGQGAEAPCSVENAQGTCLDQAPSCTQADFTGITNSEAVCTGIN